MEEFEKAIVAFEVSMSIKIVGGNGVSDLYVKMSQVIQENNMLSRFEIS